MKATNLPLLQHLHRSYVLNNTNSQTLGSLQVLRVEAPWIQNYYNSNAEHYIIPQTDCVVLGGTLQRGDWDAAPRDSDSQRIIDGCAGLLPGLRGAHVKEVWVGLRPCRSAVRLEVEMMRRDGDSGSAADAAGDRSSGCSCSAGVSNESSRRQADNGSASSSSAPSGDLFRYSGVLVPVVHCYGHGGAGITLHWGCASEVAALVEQQLENR